MGARKGCLQRICRDSYDDFVIGSKRKRRGEDSEKSGKARKLSLLSPERYHSWREMLLKVEREYVEIDQEVHRLIGAIRHFETQVHVGCRSSSCSLCGREFACKREKVAWALEYLDKIGHNKQYLKSSRAVSKHKMCHRALASRTEELRSRPDRVKDLLSGRLQALAIQGAFTLRESQCSVCKKELSPKQLRVFHDVLEKRLSVITARIATKYSARTA